MFWGYAEKGNQLNSNYSAARRSDAIFQLRLAGRARAVDAAENLFVSFNAVPDNPAIAMRANRRQRVDGALETVEGVVLPADDHFKRLVIFVVANLTCSHTQMFRAPDALWRCFSPSRAPKLICLAGTFPTGIGDTGYSSN